ncbi:MAG: hypothetical protein Q8P16_01935 [bacterium]|nr:hypothetical protein [bacterium]
MMFLKRKIIIALDKYEDEPTSMFGCDATGFIMHCAMDKDMGLTEPEIRKCVRDCIKDKYIDEETFVYPKATFDIFKTDPTEEYTHGELTLRMVDDDPATVTVKRICVSSTGRDLKKPLYFFFASIKRMGANRLIIEGVLILLAATIGYWIGN